MSNFDRIADLRQRLSEWRGQAQAASVRMDATNQNPLSAEHKLAWLQFRQFIAKVRAAEGMLQTLGATRARKALGV